MESDILCTLVMSLVDEKTTVGTIIMDDDSTTFKRLKTLLPEVTKRTDKNHVKKNFVKQLYAVSTKQKMTTDTINYFAKCFSYCCSQAKGNPDAVRRGLQALGTHPFGSHEFCQTAWCRHIDKPDAKFPSLPNGRPLTNRILQQDLQTLFARYKYVRNSAAVLKDGWWVWY